MRVKGGSGSRWAAGTHVETRPGQRLEERPAVDGRGDLRWGLFDGRDGVLGRWRDEAEVRRLGAHFHLL